MRGRTALITGSTAGLGLAAASALAEQGCNIIMTGLGEATEIESNRRSIEDDHGVAVNYIFANLEKPQEIEDLVAAAYEAFGSIDILINNAAVRHTSPVEDFKPSHWDQDIAVNLSAAFHLIRLTLRGMKAANWGRIINISSNLGMFGAPNRVGYVTTKTALIGLTRAIAMETAGTDITCNAICPSAMLGENAANLITQIMVNEGISREAATEAFLASRNRGRFVTTVPAMIVFLCSDNGRDMTGAAIPIDLGSTAGQPATATGPTTR